MNDTKNKIKDYWNKRSSTFDLSPGHVIGSREEKEAWISLFQDKLLEDAGFEQISAEPMHEISRLKAENMSLCYRIAHNHNHIQYCYTAVKPKPIGGE